MNKKIYISGRITGMEQEAPVLFAQAERMLSSRGWETVNPMTLPHQHDKSWAAFMREDIKALCDCDAIYMLDNWRRSRGAFIEWALATVLGMKILYEGRTPLFLPPFRVGRKQRRAVLDSEGREVLVVPHGLEEYASEFADYLNSKQPSPSTI